MSARVVGRSRGLVRLRELRRHTDRPDEMVEATRWLFLLLAGLSLLFSLIAPLSRTSNTVPSLALVSAVVLAMSWVRSYVTQSAPFALDLVDAAAVAAFVVAAPEAPAAFCLIFAALWFKSLYGSTRRAVLRCTLYVVGLLVGIVMWSRLPGYPAPVLGPLVGTIPTMYLTLAVGRHLAATMRGRAQAAQRSAIQALMGSQLLSPSDATEIRRLSAVATDGLCAATPGLRVLVAVQTPAGLLVDGASGFATPPTILPPEVLQLPLVEGIARRDPVGRSGPLDAAAGATCAWARLPMPGIVGDGQAVMLIGSPKRVPLEAVVSLTGMVNQVSLAMRNSEAHRALTVQATVDGLTLLANRVSFHTAVEAALADPAVEQTTVLFVDLDDFKDVNDVFGHGAGDHVLREVAARLLRATRPADMCARLGGDEFAVLLRDTTTEVAADVAHRIVAAVGAPAQLRAGVAQVGASVGVAIAAYGTPLDELIHRADVAMYAAKAKGKGRVQLFEPGLLQVDSSQLAYERQLMGAARNGEITVHYQPILSLESGRCTALEALARWQHPERGILYPVEFIEVAERIGAIRGIGSQVLRQACEESMRWRQDGSSPLDIHVNLSALQLDDDGFVGTVIQCLAEFDLAPRQLVLEITETVTISSPVTIDRLTELAHLGVTVAIDDFGTGYSALTTLRTLPVSIVKIDKSFVAGCTRNPDDRAVTEAVVDMATKMGMRTVAEGVERPEQEAFLRSIGATSAQGFRYLRPSSAEEFGSWLATHRSTFEADFVDAVVVPFAAVRGRSG